jgi:hypothetical protein
MKICTQCGKDKNETEYHKAKQNKDGLKGQCKECVLLREREYKKSNRNVLNEKQKKYYSEHVDDKKEYDRDYRKNNIDKIVGYRKEYRKNNKELLNIKALEYHKKNPHIKAYRSMLHTTLKKMGKAKEGKSIDLLGYSYLELKEHIESLFTDGMSWDNHGEWHIDHIRPISKFDKDTPQSVVNALSNLQPLWATTREINGIIYEGNLNKGKS